MSGATQVAVWELEVESQVIFLFELSRDLEMGLSGLNGRDTLFGNGIRFPTHYPTYHAVVLSLLRVPMSVMMIPRLEDDGMT